MARRKIFAQPRFRLCSLTAKRFRIGRHCEVGEHPAACRLRSGRTRLVAHSSHTGPSKGETPQHQRFYYLELLKRARLIPDYSLDSPILLEGAGEAAKAGRQQLRAAGFRESVIGVSPGAAYGGAKRWLPERFAEAAVALARTRCASVAIFGSEAEQAIGNTVQALVSDAGINAINFAGTTPLARFIEMAAACELFLTNDSGPMHIASALGVPTVAVFGATDHIATGPTGAHTRVVRHPVECSPCLLRECPIDHRCMTRVTADDVVAESLVLLNSIDKVTKR